jgi:hypothetical protein
MLQTMGSVAAGSAAGHVIGHGISSALGFGYSRHEAAPAVEDAQQQPQYSNYDQQSNPCEPDARAFSRCVEQNSNDLSKCQIYMDMYVAALKLMSRLNQCRTQFTADSKW